MELGRLNVARAPDTVLDRALEEAIATWSSARGDWYQASLDDALAELAELEKGVRVESPLQNLALYREVLEGAFLEIEDPIEAAARFLGAAAERQSPIDADTVSGINLILGVGDDLDSEQITELARRADLLREALLAAHEGEEDSGHH